jgi:hypothetical protein
MYTYKGNNNQERASMKGQKEQKLRWETILEQGECAFMHSSSNK